MNAKCDPSEEERKGGSGAVGERGGALPALGAAADGMERNPVSLGSTSRS